MGLFPRDLGGRWKWQWPVDVLGPWVRVGKEGEVEP